MGGGYNMEKIKEEGRLQRMEGRKTGRGEEGWRATPFTLQRYQKSCTRRTRPVMELGMILCSDKKCLNLNNLLTEPPF